MLPDLSSETDGRLSPRLDFNYMMENFICHVGISEEDMLAVMPEVLEAKREFIAGLAGRSSAYCVPQEASPAEAEAFSAGMAYADQLAACPDLFANIPLMLGFLGCMAKRSGRARPCFSVFPAASAAALRHFGLELRSEDGSLASDIAAKPEPWFILAQFGSERAFERECAAYQLMRARKINMTLSFPQDSLFCQALFLRMTELGSLFAGALEAASLPEKAPEMPEEKNEALPESLLESLKSAQLPLLPRLSAEELQNHPPFQERFIVE